MPDEGSASMSSTSSTSIVSTRAFPVEETFGAMADLVKAGKGARSAFPKQGRDDPPRACDASARGRADRIFAALSQGGGGDARCHARTRHFFVAFRRSARFSPAR